MRTYECLRKITSLRLVLICLGSLVRLQFEDIMMNVRFNDKNRTFTPCRLIHYLQSRARFPNSVSRPNGGS